MNNSGVSAVNDVNTVLEVDNLSVDFIGDGCRRNVVKNVSFTLKKGTTLGIVGESGSGKSVSSMSIMRLLKMPPASMSGSVLFSPGNGQPPVDLLALSESQMLQFRGRHIAMIFQEPMTSLNPVQKCGMQVVEMLLAHEKVSFQEARARTLELFNDVKLPRPEQIFDAYPHEISGGQKQRVMIAMALICHPSILIADEPTTALDVTVQKAIVELLKDLQQKYGIAIIFISHDLGVVAQIASEVAVLYKGEIVETGETSKVLCHPQHPYTQGLLACRPPLDSRPRHLTTLADYMGGTASTADEPVSLAESESPDAALPPTSQQKDILLSVNHLCVEYVLKKNIWGKPLQTLAAVDDVSFSLFRGETLGLVGESGCGKSTLGRAIMRLIEAKSGEVVFDGVRLDSLSSREMKKMRTKIQIVFQDPYSSLNPRLTVGEAIMEPLKQFGSIVADGRYANSQDRKRRVIELLEQVGLSEEHFYRYPHEFSGGQRQRICIARALVLEPELVICDESVSALDVSVQAQVLNLLNDLKEKYHYTYLFITHDLSVVKFMSDRIIVMQKGKIVEQGSAEELYKAPQTEYTRNLLSAIPRIVFDR